MATYIVLNMLFLASALGLLAWRRLLTFSRAVCLMLAVLLVMTILFDSLLIYLGIVAYSLDKISGMGVGLAPIEDFFYPLLAGLAVPAIWEGLDREEDD